MHIQHVMLGRKKLIFCLCQTFKKKSNTINMNTICMCSVCKFQTSIIFLIPCIFVKTSTSRLNGLSSVKWQSEKQILDHYWPNAKKQPLVCIYILDAHFIEWWELVSNSDEHWLLVISKKITTAWYSDALQMGL